MQKWDLERVIEPNTPFRIVLKTLAPCLAALRFRDSTECGPNGVSYREVINNRLLLLFFFLGFKIKGTVG